VPVDAHTAEQTMERSSEGGAAAPIDAAPIVPPPDQAEEEPMVTVPASVFLAMQQALQQQQQQQQQQSGDGAPRAAATRSTSSGGSMQHHPRRRQAASPPPPPSATGPPTRAAVEAEMMGMRAAEHPHVAALVSSLMQHGVAEGKPRPKNPVALLHEAANALGVKLDFEAQGAGRSFTATASAAPALGGGGGGGAPHSSSVKRTTRQLEQRGLPAYGSVAAVDGFGQVTGSGSNKRDAKNAAGARMLERLLLRLPGLAVWVWVQALQQFPMQLEPWQQQQQDAGDGAAWQSAAAGAEAAARTAEEGRDTADRQQRQKSLRVDERELERTRKEEERARDQRRQEQLWEARAGGRPHEQLQHVAARGGGSDAGDDASQIAELPALKRHLEALARRQPGQPGVSALQLLNQYAPAAMLEVEYLEVVKESSRRGECADAWMDALVGWVSDLFCVLHINSYLPHSCILRTFNQPPSTNLAPSTGGPPTFEATAVVRSRIQRTEAARCACTARSKRDAKQLAAATALDRLLSSHEGVRHVAVGEETGDRRRSKRPAPPRPRRVMDASIDYSRSLTKRFKYGGSVEESNGVEVLVPQRLRWGLGYGSSAAWEQQKNMIAPLPEQAAFLAGHNPRQQQQLQELQQQGYGDVGAGQAGGAQQYNGGGMPTFVAAGSSRGQEGYYPQQQHYSDPSYHHQQQQQQQYYNTSGRGYYEGGQMYGGSGHGEPPPPYR